MSEISYPPIDPINFDLIVVGTGLLESVISAAASAAGKSVLHLDPNSFYGSYFSSLPLDDLFSFLTSQSTTTSTLPHTDSPAAPADIGVHDYVRVDIKTRPMYSDLEISQYSSEPLLELSKKFNLDLAGPRVLYCADSAVDLMLKSGASQYMEFKSIDASFVCDSVGKLSPVPDSRAAIFKDKTLGLLEKNRLMRFFKEHLASDDVNTEKSSISEEDLKSPFVEFLEKKQLSSKLKSIILYAVAMADYDQDNMEVGRLTTKDGMERLAVYLSSVGRFPNASGAMIYPIYGQGELSQGFCRRAAVKGCIYVLRMPVNALLIDKSSGEYRGVRLSSGQDIFSHKLLLDPSFVFPPLSPSQNCGDFRIQFTKVRMVARGICITRTSLKPDIYNFLIVYPPRTLYPEQAVSVRVLQIGSNLAVCPPGMFVLYLSALCDDANQGKKLLHETLNGLFINPERDESENSEEEKSGLLWSALYIQELTVGSFGESISFGPMPDGNLNYNCVLDETVKLFQNMYPNEEFFPETTSADNSEDDGGPTLESQDF